MNPPERLVYQEDIENEILRLSQILENATGELATVSEAAANAEADYRVLYAQVFYNPDGFREPKVDKLTEKIREAVAIDVSSEELRRYKVGMARQLSLQEKCRQLRAQLDAVRTLSANVRGQT